MSGSDGAMPHGDASGREAVAVVWFRRDLRLSDQPAVDAAVASGLPVIPWYVFDPAAEGRWAPGGASRWWLHHSLESLEGALRARGSRLVIGQGDTLTALEALANVCDIQLLCAVAGPEPSARTLEERVRRRMGDRLRLLRRSDLLDPDGIRTGGGGPYQVFTPFYRKALALLEEQGGPGGDGAPRCLSAPERWPESATVEGLALYPRHLTWHAGFGDLWRPGEDGAAGRLRRFLEEAAGRYDERRDLPAEEGVSRLSPHLAFGEISPWRVWRETRAALEATGDGRWRAGAEAFLRQMIWREFARHLLFHHPHLAEEPLREPFRRFPWRDSADDLEAWARGRTGYPLVDAGMRQLWQTGWMHNRVRMVVASFLTKDLLIPWQRGAEWFWDTLVDADLSNNTFGWQWTAGCGADAAPYFRVFNPTSQGRRYDPDGAYVRRWVPELAGLSARHLHAPWTAPATALDQAGVCLGETYPRPMVDHGMARLRALQAYGALGDGRGAPGGP